MSRHLSAEAEEEEEKSLPEPRSDNVNHIVLRFNLKPILNKHSNSSFKRIFYILTDNETFSDRATTHTKVPQKALLQLLFLLIYLLSTRLTKH
jgi:hypothetical protein